MADLSRGQLAEQRQELLAASRASSQAVDLGQPIGYARLKARPESSFCLDCQGRLEGAG